MFNLKSITDRIKAIVDKEGFASLFKRASMYLIHKIIIYENYYLMENSLKDLKEDPDDFVPNLPNLSHRFVKTNQEANQVACEFCEFRSYSLNAYDRLDKGAMAFCIFIGTDLAYICWTAMTEEAKKTVTDFPYKINFNGKNVFAGSEFTSPKYRRKGLSIHGRLLQDRFLKEIGINKKYGELKKNDLIAMKAKTESRYKIYADCRYLKILGLKLWKETQISPPRPVSQMLPHSK